MPNQSKQILFFIPNIIGYIRIILLTWAAIRIQFPYEFLLLYTLSAFLDLFDGIFARAFGQTSVYGAWLDVIIDNISRAFIWTQVSRWGWIISSIEWIAFVGNHREAGVKWRDMKYSVESPPTLLLRVMANGFKTPLGTVTILGLHALPVWLYAIQEGVLPLNLLIFSILGILIIGRIICFICEVWCIQRHIKSLLAEDQQE